MKLWEQRGPDHLVYIIIMKKVQIYSNKKVEEFNFVLKNFYIHVPRSKIYSTYTTWTVPKWPPKSSFIIELCKREEEWSYFYFPQLFFSPQDTLKKEFNNWAGGCLGGRSPFMHLTRVMFRESTQKCRMRQENWDFSDLWKIEQNLFVFPQLIHRWSCTLGPNHVKNCKKNKQLYVIPSTVV